MLSPTLKKNNWFKPTIWILSIVVFLIVAALPRITYFHNLDLGFDPHIFAVFNAVNNGIVAFLLAMGLLAIKNKNYQLHKKIMLAAITLSALFLLSYVTHHLLAGETKYGDLNHDKIVDDLEKQKAGSMRAVYFFILFTHIPLAGIILPFILFSAYSALTGEYVQHKKLVRFTWPIWFYVAITGVLVYLMISKYY